MRSVPSANDAQERAMRRNMEDPFLKRVRLEKLRPLVMGSETSSGSGSGSVIDSASAFEPLNASVVGEDALASLMESG